MEAEARLRAGRVPELSGIARIVAALALAVLALAATAASAAAYTLTVRDVHVTQGTQTVAWEPGNLAGIAPQPGNTIPLVNWRSTAVRVLLGFEPQGEEPTPELRGRLRVFVNGTERFAEPIAAANEPFFPPRVADIRDEPDTLNFELSQTAADLLATFPGHPAYPGELEQSADVDFRVEILDADGDVVAAGAAEDLTVVRVPAVSIHGVPVHYVGPVEPGVRTTPNPAVIPAGVADAFIAAAWPVDDSCLPPLQCTIGLGTGFETPVSPYRVTPPIEVDADPRQNLTQMIEKLQAYRNLHMLYGQEDPSVYVWGWVSDDLVPGGATIPKFMGGASPASNVGIGNDTAEKAQRTFAHEFGHMHNLVDVVGGVPHHPCPEDQRGNCVVLEPNLGWDVHGRLVANPPENRATGRIKGFAIRDVMNDGGGGPFSASSWPNADMYLRFLEEHRTRGGNVRAPSTARGRSAGGDGGGRACERTLSITGTVSRFNAPANRARAGVRDLIARRARLDPIFTDQDCMKNPPRPARRKDAHLVAVVTMRDGDRLRTLRWRIDAGVIYDYELPAEGELGPRLSEQVELGPFAATVPVRGEVVRVRLTTPGGGRMLDRQRDTDAAPKLDLRGLRPGDELTPRTTLRWNARDRDTRKAKLTYQVLYSPNGGRDIYPVGIDLDQRRTGLDFRGLPAPEGNGVVRVIASDGLNTRADKVSGLEFGVEDEVAD